MFRGQGERIGASPAWHRCGLGTYESGARVTGRIGSPPYSGGDYNPPDKAPSSREMLKLALLARLKEQVPEFPQAMGEKALKYMDGEIDAWLDSSRPSSERNLSSGGWPPETLVQRLVAICEQIKSVDRSPLRDVVPDSNPWITRRETGAIGRSTGSAGPVSSRWSSIPLDVGSMQLWDACRATLGLPKFLSVVRRSHSALAKALQNVTLNPARLEASFEEVVQQMRAEMGLSEALPEVWIDACEGTKAEERLLLANFLHILSTGVLPQAKDDPEMEACITVINRVLETAIITNEQPSKHAAGALISLRFTSDRGSLIQEALDSTFPLDVDGVARLNQWIDDALTGTPCQNDLVLAQVLSRRLSATANPGQATDELDLRRTKVAEFAKQFRLAHSQLAFARQIKKCDAPTGTEADVVYAEALLMLRTNLDSTVTAAQWWADFGAWSVQNTDDKVEVLKLGRSEALQNWIFSILRAAWTQVQPGG
jgi:hypothetical protein